MSNEEIKSEINQVLDRLSNESLQELLSFLKKIDAEPLLRIDPAVLKKILTEDNELLKKLAQ